jgi:hypothetical protein
MDKERMLDRTNIVILIILAAVVIGVSILRYWGY